MSEPTIETLARRLDRVERENRRMKQAGVVAFIVTALEGDSDKQDEAGDEGPLGRYRLICRMFLGSDYLIGKQDARQ